MNKVFLLVIAVINDKAIFTFFLVIKEKMNKLINNREVIMYRK